MLEQSKNKQKAPTILSKKITLRVLGTKVTLIEPLRKAAEKDLGIHLEFILKDGTDAQAMAALEPNGFDIYDQWFHDIDMIWPTSSLQAVDINRIKSWNALRAMPHLSQEKFGQCLAETSLGSTPLNRLYVQYNGELSKKASETISLVPTVHNADSFAIINGRNLDGINSWASLMSNKSGVTLGLQSDASIGALDAIMSFKSQGIFDCVDVGNLSLSEIDEFTQIMRSIILRHRKKRKIHFWREGKMVLNMAKQGVELYSSMWWSLFLELKAAGCKITAITPKEGYRGWYGGIGLARHLSGKKLDAAYDYINWWHSGYAGSLMVRNGAYMGDVDTTKKYLSDAEFAFWYEGKEATETILNAYGNSIFSVGEKREGGAYLDRMSRIAVWNTVMDEHNYLVRNWSRLQS
ncbi:MAG: ABC transporter [Alphaproteobacteria bacterium]